MKSSLSRFVAALGSLRQTPKIEALLREILTPGEFHDLALRWEIVELLAAGVSQRQIAARLGVSLCKITRGAKILKKRNGVVASLVAKPAEARPAKKTEPVKKPASARKKPVTVQKGLKKHGTRVAR